MCGLMYCCRCKLRDCSCCKRFLRATGTDPFDDFELLVLVHEAAYTSKSKIDVFIRIRAGDHLVETASSPQGIFQQAVCIFIPQGTDFIILDLMNSSKKVLAELKLPIVKDVLDLSKGKPFHIVEKNFVMKGRSKSILNPKLKLSFSQDFSGDEETALLAGLNASSETEFMLQQQIQKVVDEGEGNSEGKLSELDVLIKSCAGPLEKFGTFGYKEKIYAAVVGPPSCPKYAFQWWGSKDEMDANRQPKDSIELLRITSVIPDPDRVEVLVINYLDHHKVKRKVAFNRLDRSREVWVELLQLVVTKVREERDKKKKIRK